MKTKQELFWEGTFGKEYTNRTTRSALDWDKFYLENWGSSRIEINSAFLENVPKEARILEVGCNTGLQLDGLQRSGFTNLWGIELQEYAVELSKQYTTHVNIVQASGFDIPFKDNFFDLVATNGVLIHIAPADHASIMTEIVRCTRKYVCGWEYFAPTLTEIEYRGNIGYLWKADYSALFMQYCPGLRLVKKSIYPYVSATNAGNAECMYLLEKC